MTNLLSSYMNTVPVVHLSIAPTNCRLLSCVGRLRKCSVTMSASSQNTTVISSRNKTLFTIFKITRRFGSNHHERRWWQPFNFKIWVLWRPLALSLHRC